jgi:hypothetical protein
MDDALSTSTAPASTSPQATIPLASAGAGVEPGAGEDGLTWPDGYATDAGITALMAELHRKVAQQAADDAARGPLPPLTCGSAVLRGGHLWRNDYQSIQGQHVACECGARARFGFEGRLFSDVGYGPPPADPVPATVAS